MADTFRSHLEWSGAREGPTHDPIAFSRNLEMSFDAATLPMSSAPNYRGDPRRTNPEQLFVAAVSSCQALTFLFLCAKKGIAVTAYTDDAEGQLEVVDGRLRMSRVTLRPRITLEPGSSEPIARTLIDRAHGQCFIANSISAAVEIEPTFGIDEAPMAAVRGGMDGAR